MRCAVRWQEYCTIDAGISVCMTMNMLHTHIKEQPYGTRIDHVAVRRPAGGDSSVVSLPCYLALQRRIHRLSLATARPMRLLSP